MSLKNLMVVVGAKTEEFEKKMSGVTTKLETIGKKTSDVGKSMTTWVTGPIAAVGTGLFALATKAGNVSDRLLDLADITGMSTDAIQEYQYVAKQAGVSTEAITSAAEGLIRRLPSLIEGESQAADAIRGLGVSFTDTNDQMRSGEAIMDDLINALAAMEDPVERNKIGSQAFGGAWKDLAPILAMGTDGISAARQEARDLGIVMNNDALKGANEFRQGIERLKAQFGALFLELGTKIAPMLNDTLVPIISDKVIPIVISFVNRIGNLVEWFGNLSSPMQNTILVIVGLVAAIGPVLLVVGKLMTAFSAIMPVITALKGWMAALAIGPAAPIILVGAAIAGLVYLVVKHWDEIKDAISSAVTFIGGILKPFAEFFTSLFEGIRKNTVGVFESMWDNIKQIINWIIGGVNKMIHGLNNFSIDVPSWVPGFGGNKFGFNISPIPQLAKGGNITSPGTVMVGEQGPELLHLPRGAQVEPLGKNRNGITVKNTFYSQKELDEKELDRRVELSIRRLELEYGRRF